MAYRIHTRSQWGAASPKRSIASIKTPTPELWLHHTVTSGIGYRAAQNVQQVAFGRGYADVSYTFLVDQAGNVFEGRGVGKEGAHTSGRNLVSHAIAAIGNFENDRPTKELVDSLTWLVAEGRKQGWWHGDLSGGHRDVSKTACPGKYLYERISEINAKAGEYLKPPQEPGRLIGGVDYGDTDMRSIDIQSPTLDDQGNGHFSLAEVGVKNVPAQQEVVSVLPNDSSYSSVQARAYVGQGGTRLVVVGGPPRGKIALRVWAVR